MKSFFIIFLIGLGGFTSVAQAQKTKLPKEKTDTSLQIVEAACGQCKFGLPGKTCDLAVRMDGKAYFVDGTHIDSHGDAHAADGFCESVRKAAVRGSVTDGRFKATYFKLVADSIKVQ